ncbi:MAG: hypothetical protein ABIM85_02215 [candidate division WOR-3 bacterium]
MLNSLIFIILNQSPKIFVEPARIENFYLKGKEYTEVLIVESQEAPSHIEIYLEDFIINERGEVKFNEKIDGYSLKNLVKVSPRSFDLALNEKKEVRISFILPDTMKANEKWCMIIVRAYPIKKEIPSIQVVGEIGIPLYAMYYGSDFKRVELLNMGKFEDKVFFTLYNLSPIHIRTSGTVYIKNNKKTLWEKKFENYVILPLQKRRYEFNIHEIKKGTYTLICEIDYSSDEILKGESIIEIK